MAFEMATYYKHDCKPKCKCLTRESEVLLNREEKKYENINNLELFHHLATLILNLKKEDTYLNHVILN